MRWRRRSAGLGIDASLPRLYPEYAADYYATFFPDPDGMRLEVWPSAGCARPCASAGRELTEFEDPVTKAGWRR